MLKDTFTFSVAQVEHSRSVEVLDDITVHFTMVETQESSGGEDALVVTVRTKKGTEIEKVMYDRWNDRKMVTLALIPSNQMP